MSGRRIRQQVLTSLDSRHVDLIIADIMMPRMDGHSHPQRAGI